ncbi:hypothetical protein F511_01104 [Dorcoceras hygrometricum]|nr:hypothetical protein F511_01104 [Dorcoceras hygrometricum]
MSAATNHGSDGVESVSSKASSILKSGRIREQKRARICVLVQKNVIMCPRMDDAYLIFIEGLGDGDEHILTNTTYIGYLGRDTIRDHR